MPMTCRGVDKVARADVNAGVVNLRVMAGEVSLTRRLRTLTSCPSCSTASAADFNSWLLYGTVTFTV